MKIQQFVKSSGTPRNSNLLDNRSSTSWIETWRKSKILEDSQQKFEAQGIKMNTMEDINLYPKSNCDFLN